MVETSKVISGGDMIGKFVYGPEGSYSRYGTIQIGNLDAPPLSE